MEEAPGSRPTASDNPSRPSSAASGPPHMSLPPPHAASNSSSTTAGAARSRPIVGLGAQGQPTDPSLQPSKRRRGHGIVTQNACTECRKKRAKCDGQKPCGRCRTQDISCVYEIPARQSKDSLRHEIKHLRSRQRSHDQVIAALLRPNLLPEVLNRLRNGHTVEVVSDWLSNGGAGPGPRGRGGGAGSGSLPSFMGSLNPPGNAGGLSALGFTGQGRESMSALSLGVGAPLGSVAAQHQHQPALPSRPALKGPETDQIQHSPWHFSSHPQSTTSESYSGLAYWAPEVSQGPSRVGSWVESMRQGPGGTASPRYRWLDHLLSSAEVAELKVTTAQWTKITSDVKLIQHLLALYFCWEYPTFASLSQEHFLKDFKDGTRRYCSSMLVNALLALGCRFSTKPNTRAIPDDLRTSGDHFFKESMRLYRLEEDHRTLTTVQALGIMSIREASCGRDSESCYYAGQSIRLAVEMGLHLANTSGDDDETSVQAATFWGAFALDHAWSLATGSLPQYSWVLHLPPKPAIIDEVESSLWIAYTDDGVPLQRSCEQLSNVRSVYKCFCELSELVHKSLYILHSPGRPVMSRDLLVIYTQYLDWYNQVPEVLRLGHNFTPAVLFAHMYYHFSILLLFRPLIKLRIIGSRVLPRDVCAQAADAIQGLLRSYAQLYTLRHTPSFVPYFALTSAIMQTAIAASTPAPSPSSLRAPPPTSSQAQKHVSPSQKSATNTGPSPPSPRDPASSSPQVDPRLFKCISQGIEDLTEMAPCHHFARQALNILWYLAKKWKLDVDLHKEVKSEGVDSASGPGGADTGATGASCGAPEMLERLRSAEGLNLFAPSVQLEDFVCAWATGADSLGGMADLLAGTEGGGEQSGPAGEAAQNPLFWPFPLQGRPILPPEPELRDAGFALL